MEYAVIENGGKQYTVRPGQSLKVAKMDAADASSIDLDRVLMISKDGQVKIGRPFVEGAKVTAQVVSQGRHPKITVFKYKNKTRYKRTMGHKQHFTEIQITEIVGGTKPAARRRSPRSKAGQDGS